jgi:hypothetical protein
VSQEKNDSGQRVVAPLPKTYAEWHGRFPNVPPTVRINFHGLFSFFLDDKKCFAGTHNTTRRPGHPHTDHPHEYGVTIEQKDAGIPTEIRPYMVNTGSPLDVPALDFKVTGSAFPGGVAPGVYVYTGPRHAQFNRDDDDDERDWRWMIDFEDRVYPEGVQGVIWEAIQPGITIDNGLFHTYLRTDSQFDLVPEGGGADIPLNSIAQQVAANIYLAPGGTVQLTGGPVGNRVLTHEKNRTYEVYISNLCNGKNNASCDYDSNAGTKKGRNDFFLHYETFNRPLARPEYMLIKRADSMNKLLAELFIMDDAPCGSVGYGGTPPP